MIQPPHLLHGQLKKTITVAAVDNSFSAATATATVQTVKAAADETIAATEIAADNVRTEMHLLIPAEYAIIATTTSLEAIKNAISG